jgi:hypothetical protein
MTLTKGSDASQPSARLWCSPRRRSPHSAGSGDPGTSPDCVAQYVSDVHTADVQTVGQTRGALPNGQAHTLQLFGTPLQYQATADHGDCPFTYQP